MYCNPGNKFSYTVCKTEFGFGRGLMTKNVPTSLKPLQNDLIYLKINRYFQIDALKYSNNNQTLHTYLILMGEQL
jgi:hypothetical protein